MKKFLVYGLSAIFTLSTFVCVGCDNHNKQPIDNPNDQQNNNQPPALKDQLLTDERLAPLCNVLQTLSDYNGSFTINFNSTRNSTQKESPNKTTAALSMQTVSIAYEAGSNESYFISNLDLSLLDKSSPQKISNLSFLFYSTPNSDQKYTQYSDVKAIDHGEMLKDEQKAIKYDTIQELKENDYIKKFQYTQDEWQGGTSDPVILPAAVGSAYIPSVYVGENISSLTQKVTSIEFSQTEQTSALDGFLQLLYQAATRIDGMGDILRYTYKSGTGTVTTEGNATIYKFTLALEGATDMLGDHIVQELTTKFEFQIENDTLTAIRRTLNSYVFSTTRPETTENVYTDEYAFAYEFDRSHIPSTDKLSSFPVQPFHKN